MRLAALLLLALSVPIATPAPSSSLEELLPRVADYVVRLHDRLRVIICDEAYIQERRYQTGRIQRFIHADVLFMWVPEHNTWLTVRNIREVDGHPVPDSRQRIEKILSAAGPDMLPTLFRLQREGARFDVGVTRTTSNPLLVLEYLTAAIQPHLQFSDDGGSRSAGNGARRIAFAEREPISLVLVDGRPAAVSGRIWIHPTDGAIVRSILRVAGGGQVSVAFAWKAAFATWVPVRMDERYDDGTACRSIYSRFRRFETSGRIVR